MSQHRTLDILMPFHGRFDHLRVAVRSVLGQQDPRWRLVVIDDAYPDPGPGQWVAGLDDPRIEYHRNPVNEGISATFNQALGRATAEFCVLMGCDDELLPGYVGRVLDLIAQHPEAGLVQPGVEVMDADGHPVQPLGDRVKARLRPPGTPAREYRGEELAMGLLRGNWAYFPSLAWRTETARAHGFRADLRVVQDLALILQLVREGAVMLVDDEPVFRYRRHAASASAAMDAVAQLAQERRLFAEESAALTGLGWYRAARAARRHLTSRLNALVQLPAVARTGRLGGAGGLLRHAFGSTGTPG